MRVRQRSGGSVSNAGRPAVIKFVTFYVDRKAVRDANEASLTYAKLSEAELDYTELELDDTLAVGEKGLWFIQYRNPRGDQINHKNHEKFADFVDQHLAIEIKFCSIMGNCWTKCSARVAAADRMTLDLDDEETRALLSAIVVKSLPALRGGGHGKI